MLQLQQFWNWFVENEETYYRLHRMPLEEKTYHFEQLLTYLRGFDPCVSVQLAGPVQLGKATLTFTCDGKPEGILYVQNLVAQAPALPRWNIIAFVQPTLDLDACERRMDDEYNFPGMPIKASDVYWLPLKPQEGDTSGKLDLIICFKGFDESVKGLGYRQVQENIYHIFMELLGELELHRRIGIVYFEELNPKREPLELYLLPDYLELEMKT
ncbi:hypothetical protein [Altibacter lentus]|uniref:hypothetical protein n=1 Tax=Altibacter lentus TaxID=1223410 RepID=UPI0005520453|nr:hypothetical protein [Altibacter lentus]